MMEFHPLADLFPLMQGAEFDALVADISENGLREPIVLHNGQILDGRNRFRACLEAEIEPTFVQWENSSDPRAYVVSKNLHRRHLNASQRALIAAKLADAKQGEIGGGHKAEHRIRLSDAAALLNVGKTTVTEAKKILSEGTPEQIKSIESGTASADKIASQIRADMPAEKRRKSREASISHVGKNPERIQRQQINAEIWGRVRDALGHLTNLPVASEVAVIARTNDKAGFVDARLAKSIQWLKDFSDAWNRDV